MHQSNLSIALKLSTYYPFWGRLYSYGGERKKIEVIQLAGAFLVS